MYKEISRTPIEGMPGVSLIQRIKGTTFETLKETVVNSGEIQNPQDELTTTETIVITRKITKTEF